MPGYPGGSSNRNPRRELWTKDTDLVLRDLVLRSGEVDWTKIALAIEWDSGTVTPAECKERYVCMFLFLFLYFIPLQHMEARPGFLLTKKKACVF